jgi:hypothetical protein
MAAEQLDRPPQTGDTILLLGGITSTILRQYFSVSPGRWRVSYDTPDGARGCEVTMYEGEDFWSEVDAE